MSEELKIKIQIDPIEGLRDLGKLTWDMPEHYSEVIEDAFSSIQDYDVKMGELEKTIKDTVQSIMSFLITSTILELNTPDEDLPNVREVIRDCSAETVALYSYYSLAKNESVDEETVAQARKDLFNLYQTRALKAAHASNDFMQ